VIGVDEFGPLELRPHAGRSWQPRTWPERQRATYRRPHGVRHFIAAYDVGTGQIWGHFRQRKRAHEFLLFLKALRRKYTGPIRVVLDNFSPHKTPAVVRWTREHQVHLQFIPTDASWLNRIECHFTHLKKNVLTHCDYGSFDSMRRAIHNYLRWYSRRQKKRRLNWKRH
jgi:transposase